MILIFLVFVLGKKNDYFKSLKGREYPREESTVAAAEITHLKSLMKDKTGANFKVS